ncbi:MAG: PAS domain-containing sensor histidine kinase, partial [Clostridia bacterium]|nr:PAS domain-containing sensor histidine kinase [Clostridia bacterium]
PFKTTDGSDGLIAVIQDITEQHRLDNARREFVANVSHELRTPLTTVKSYAETLSDITDDNNLDPQICKSFLKIINDETDRMTRLVKDLLLLSRLDYSLKDMPKEDFDISEMLRSLVERLSMSTKEKEQTLVYEPTNTLPIYNGSPDRIEQVLINVITNAVKYTPKGGHILVTSMYMYNSITIKVIDDGIGIPEENLQHIFERFYRVDKARSREMGGTGLGLAIAKEIIEAHDGTIEIKSKSGHGTEVIINLPVEIVESDFDV